MSDRSLQRRLHATRRQACDQTYKRLARLITGPIRAEDESHIAQLFTFVMDTERELGTPVETVVAQLPGELAKVVRVAARMVLDQRQHARERQRAR
jgi:hypothetical protein